MLQNSKREYFIEQELSQYIFIYFERKINGFNAAVNSMQLFRSCAPFVFFIKSAKIHRMHYGALPLSVPLCALFLRSLKLAFSANTQWWNVLFSQFWFIWHGFIMKMLKNGVSAKANRNNDELRLQQRQEKKSNRNKIEKHGKKWNESIEAIRFKMVTKLCHG